MKDRGIGVSREFVRKVLADNKLKPIPPRSFVPRTTDSRHMLGYSPNLLLARLRPTGPHQVWVSDITAGTVLKVKFQGKIISISLPYT